MQVHAATSFPRSRRRDEAQSTLSYWATGFTCIAAMVAVCLFAGLRF